MSDAPFPPRYRDFDANARVPTGKVIERGTPEFDRLMQGEQPQPADGALEYPTPAMQPGARAIIWLDIEKVGTSCGYAVPFMKFESHRAFCPSPVTS